MMCEYCEYNEAGNLKWLRDDPECSAWLEEYSDEWGILADTGARCCGVECTTEFYMAVNNCPMCGRDLRIRKAVGR